MRPPPAWAHRVAASAAVLLGTSGAAVALVVGHSTSQLRAESAAREAAADGVAELTYELRQALDEATRTSDSPPVPLAQARDRGVPLPTLVRARDTGEPVLAETGEVVVARYRTPGVPSSTAARRASVTGVDLTPLRAPSLLAATVPPSGGIVLSGPERVVGQAPGPVPDDAVTFRVGLPETLVADWQVVTWTPDPRVPAAAWVAAAALLLSGLGAAAVIVTRARRRAEARIAAERRRSQQETLSTLSTVSQSSLELADVLPAVATHLHDALRLRGLRLSVPAGDTDRSLFTTGQVSEPALPAPVPALATGETVSFLLARAGRTVARLTVTAGRDLDELDLETLRGAATILTSALANAEAYSQQRELLARMREVDELKTVFLATASHELRTPVGIINGFARLLSQQVGALSPEQVATFAERVEVNARQLSDLVENLLDFSRLERGVNTQAEPEVIDLGATVRAALDQHADVAPNHTVVLHAPPGCHVRGTAGAVERVLTNLVGNAGKYSPAGTTIHVRVQHHDDRVQLVVDDEGPGVPEAERGHVFSRFFRGRGDAVLNTRGAGLGLAIVREFAHAMDGQVSVGEAPSGGARFVVSYPVAAPVEEGPATRSTASVEGDADVAT